MASFHSNGFFPSFNASEFEKRCDLKTCHNNNNNVDDDDDNDDDDDGNNADDDDNELHIIKLIDNAPILTKKRLRNFGAQSFTHCEAKLLL